MPNQKRQETFEGDAKVSTPSDWATIDGRGHPHQQYNIAPMTDC